MDRSITPDPRLDLVLERVVDVPPEKVWAAWTRPEHLVKWFTPRPWSTVDCEIDLRPGGVFRTVMPSPEGEDHDSRWVANECRRVWQVAGFPPLGSPCGMPF